MAELRAAGPPARVRTGGRFALGVRALGLAVAVQVVLTGCAAGEPRPRPSVSGSAPATATEPAAVPADGRLLRDFGYRHGPVGSFSLPSASVLVTSVDQPDNVTAVLSAPDAEQVADYLRRALPRAGYAVTADDPGTSTLTFTGPGWTGSFTGGNGRSAVVLRPA